MSDLVMTHVTPGMWFSASNPDLWQIEVLAVHFTTDQMCFDFNWVVFDGTRPQFLMRRSSWRPKTDSWFFEQWTYMIEEEILP